MKPLLQPLIISSSCRPSRFSPESQYLLWVLLILQLSSLSSSPSSLWGSPTVVSWRAFKAVVWMFLPYVVCSVRMIPHWTFTHRSKFRGQVQGLVWTHVKKSQGRILNFQKAGELLLKGTFKITRRSDSRLLHTTAQTSESITNIHPHQFSLLRALILTHFTGNEYVHTYAVTSGPYLRPHLPLFLSQVMDAQKVRVWSIGDQSSSEWKLGEWGGRTWWRERCKEMEAEEGGLAASC